MSLPNYGANVPNLSNQGWVSNSDFQYGGFSGLHDAAGNCLRGIFPNFEYFNGFTLNPNDLLDIDENNVDVNEIVNGNAGPLAFGIVGLILAFGMIIMGVAWCVISGVACCKSCKRKVESWEYVENRFGKRDQAQPPKRKNKNMKLRIGLGALLFCWMVLFLTFLVGLFITNGQLEGSIEDLTDEIDGYLNDAELYIEVTISQFEAVMKTSYDQLSVIIKEEGQCVKNGLSKEDKTTNDVLFFEESKFILSKLDTSVRQILNELQQQSNLQVPPFLTFVNSKANNIEKNIHKFENSSRSSVRNVCDAIEVARATLAQNADEIIATLRTIPIQQSRDDLESVEDVFQTAKDVIFHSVNVLNVILLLLLVIISGGAVMLFLPPTKTIGSFSLNCALFTIFITGWIMWIFALGLFFLSGSLVVIVPGAFDNIAENGSLVNNYENFKADEYVLPSAPHILTKCKDLESAYEVFDLIQVYDVNELDDILELFFPETTPFLNEALRDVENMKMVIKTVETDSQIPRHKIETLTSMIRKLETSLKVEAERSKSRSLMTKDDEVIRQELTHYIDFAKDQIETKVGSCEPLWGVLESTIHTFSYKLGSPIGGYWFALNFIMFLLFPIIITVFFLLRV